MNLDNTNYGYDFYYMTNDNTRIDGESPIQIKIKDIDTLDKLKENIKEKLKTLTTSNALEIHDNEEINIYTTDGEKLDNIDTLKKKESRVYNFKIEQKSFGGRRRRSSAAVAKKRASARRGTKKRASARRQRHSRRRRAQ